MKALAFNISTVMIFTIIVMGVFLLLSGVFKDIIFATGVKKTEEVVYTTNIDNIKFELTKCERDESDFTAFSYEVRANEIKFHTERKTDIVPVLFFKGKLTPSTPEIVEKNKVETGNLPPLAFNVVSSQPPSEEDELYTLFFFQKSDRCLEAIKNPSAKPEDVVRSCASSFLPGKVEKFGSNCKETGAKLKNLQVVKTETKGKRCEAQIRVFNNDLNGWTARDSYYTFVKNCMEKAPPETYSGFRFPNEPLNIQSKFFQDISFVKKDGFIHCDINPKIKTVDLYKNCVFDDIKLTCRNFDPKDPSAKDNPVQLIDSIDFGC